MRLADAKRDRYRKLAKEQGFRSRSAYKLAQINHSYRILKKGDRVLDLGCAPGGWIQVALKEIGDAGRILGLDLKDVAPIEAAVIIKADIEDPKTRDAVIRELGGAADVVLSDLAPNVSGIWDIDHARQISLTYAALSLCKGVLSKGGKAVFKVFEGEQTRDLRSDLTKLFSEVLVSKPSASRQESSELYFVCRGFLGDRLPIEDA